LATSDEQNATQIKASDAAKSRADELGVDLATVEPTGAQGQIKVEDVENAAQRPEAMEEQADSEVQAGEEEEADRMIKVKINPDLRGHYFTGSDGSNYTDGQPVSERYFDEVLKDDADRDGNKLFKKGGAA
jgi:pyruvate dehydrogenase E2 component (dihydrolipoamide acetyltransferase)